MRKERPPAARLLAEAGHGVLTVLGSRGRGGFASLLLGSVSQRVATHAPTPASHRAQLVVVGSRGHGVVAGTMLGSTGLQLLHHADCPVYLVRAKH